MSDDPEVQPDRFVELMNAAFEEARKRITPDMLPRSVRPSLPGEIELMTRLSKAALRDAPEAIAEVQSIVGQLAVADNRAKAEGEFAVAVKLAREEEERQALAEEQRRAADIERTAARTAALVVGALARSRLESAPEPPPQPQLPPPVEKISGNEPGDDQVFSVDEICARNKMSRSTLYKLWRRDSGPERYGEGKFVRITRRAERLWQQRQREADN